MLDEECGENPVCACHGITRRYCVPDPTWNEGREDHGGGGLTNWREIYEYVA